MRNEIRDALESIANSWVIKTGIAVFAASVAATAAIAITQNLYQWAGATPHTGIASINVGQMGIAVGTIGTATAFLTTLYVAERNYRRSREHIPHLTMALQSDRVNVSPAYDAVIITLSAKNTGSGLCEIGQIHWAVSALSPTMTRQPKEWN